MTGQHDVAGEELDGSTDRGDAASASQAVDLRGKIRTAVGWSFANSLLSRFGQVAVGILLARLITPREFGVYAAALVVINIMLSIADLGVSTVIVRHQGDLRRVVPTVTTVAIGSGFVLASIIFFGAPTFASSLGVPEATGVIRLLAVALLISGFSAVPGAILQREFRQDHLLFAEGAAFVLSTTVVVVLALSGFGPWALAWSRIVAHGVSAPLMFFFAKEPFRPGFDRREAREILSFSLPLAGASLLVFTVLNVDYIVVGAILGPVQLGYYLIAFNLSSWPVMAIATTVRSVSMAGFAQLRHDDDGMRQGFGRSLVLLVSLATPACVLLAALAVPLVRFLYGDRWVPAAAALAVLSALGLLRVALELAYDYLAVAGRSRSIFAVHALWLVGLVPALAVGAKLGEIRGVSWGHVVVVLLLVTPAYIVALRRTGLMPSDYLPGLARPLAAGVVMAVVAYSVSTGPSGDFLKLAMGGVAGMAAYLALMLSGESGLLAAANQLLRARNDEEMARAEDMT